MARLGLDEDLLERDQVFRAGYLAGAADAYLGEHGASFDENDSMQGRKQWHRGYEKGFKDYDIERWRLPE